MSDSFTEAKRELYELMQRMHRGGMTTPMPEGVTPSEARTIMTISMVESCGETARPGRVAEMAHMTPSALSQTLKSLEEKGLIERHRTSDDYRAISVSLTASGEHIASEGFRMRDAHLERIMSYVGEDDMRHLVRIMRKVVDFHEYPEDEAAQPRCNHTQGDDASCA